MIIKDKEDISFIEIKMGNKKYKINRLRCSSCGNNMIRLFVLNSCFGVCHNPRCELRFLLRFDSKRTAIEYKRLFKK